MGWATVASEMDFLHKEAKKAHELVELFKRGGFRQRFGVGDPQTECAECPEISVFMESDGGVQNRRLRTLLPPETPLRQLRSFYERDFGTLSPTRVADENGYAMSTAAMDRPLTDFFSNG